MIKRVTRHGNSLALVIERGVLEILDSDAETPLSISTDGRCLIVSPVRGEADRKKFRAALGRVNKRYGRALKRLAE
ncbi:MAG: AbrB family transcriptional regulator [Candidatus Handelsmanbacteria bacterium RIFCSPLOWO2_12_FULL_64_10]|uniref:AbrB family transcriptional regulator n=1 Tax=Handelsmanbacteria sp. (strain RIFCSPLOWO2_12_FULL_64_10) TaxID=1817868 RepID=A0A1F6CRC5_HANXR|nr:MAG: AbrB family transcriptional regulator [Candidatus Handelsmanbacteria bacterium RIFCSPLOWO2_12_FULL_64_10]